MKRFDEALRHLQYAAQLDPGDPIAATLLGQVLQSAGRFADAEKWYQVALQIDALYDEAYLHIGRLYEQLGRPEAAIASYGTFIGIAKRRPKTEELVEKVRNRKLRLEALMQ